jgi:FkbM family methyltransferase
MKINAMNILKKIALNAFDRIPADNSLLLKIAQRYVDRHNGENNSNLSTNGEENILRQVLPKLVGCVVFDVGANVGNWSDFALSVEPSLKLHLFEPSKVSYEQCLKKNWLPSVQINNIGLGECNETLQLNIVTAAGGMNSIHKRHGVESAVATSTESIKISTLDEYCENNNIIHIDFMKVDVEGHELAVFKGSRKMLEKGAIEMIQFEYGGCNLDARVYLLDIWSLLTQYGFKINKIYPDGPRHMKVYAQTLENFQYANYLATKI